jgi:hypothetical protein
MQPRPGRIKRIVDVNLSRERDRSSVEFTAIKEAVLREFVQTQQESRVVESAGTSETVSGDQYIAADALCC